MKKLKQYKKITKDFFEDIWGWMLSVYVFYFRPIEAPATFFGYGAFYWAGAYARKRTRKWKAHWDQMGKQQGVIPFGDTHLMVCSKMELEWYKKKKILTKKAKPKKMIKYAYLKTEL